MLHILKRLHLLWIREGEGPWPSRIFTIVALLCLLGSIALSRSGLTASGEALDHFGVILTAVLGIIAAVMVLHAIFQKIRPFHSHHPAGALTAEHLTTLPPEPNRHSPYRFHLAESVHDLKPFVDESEYFLSTSNPDLAREARQDLYERWLGLNQRSFLYLSKVDRKCPVALSIILPLNQVGYDRLHGINYQPKKKVIDFGTDEIARRGPYRYLLVDTFIICKREERNHRLTPVASGGRRYGRALLLRHVALFWRNRGRSPKTLAALPDPAPVTIIGETSKDKLIQDLVEIGFAQRGESAIGCSVFEFDYPHASADPARLNLIHATVANIWQLKSWKIYKGSRLSQ